MSTSCTEAACKTRALYITALRFHVLRHVVQVHENKGSASDHPNHKTQRTCTRITWVYSRNTLSTLSTS
eukprot:2555615-Amphidinium_carterae.1